MASTWADSSLIRVSCFQSHYPSYDSFFAITTKKKHTLNRPKYRTCANFWLHLLHGLLSKQQRLVWGGDAGDVTTAQVAK